MPTKFLLQTRQNQKKKTFVSKDREFTLNKPVTNYLVKVHQSTMLYITEACMSE